MTMQKRVVVTGLGAITPVGNTVDELWSGLRAGRSGLGPVTLFDASRLNSQVAAEVKGFEPDPDEKPSPASKSGRGGSRGGSRGNASRANEGGGRGGRSDGQRPNDRSGSSNRRGGRGRRHAG